MMFPKPIKELKEKKPYNSLQQRKPKQKEIAPWRQDILSSHRSKPSRADRAEFPLAVVEKLIERAGGVCECCKQRQDTDTHHIRSRARDGRGVFQNGLRVCRICHTYIQTNETELKYWEGEWVKKYGPNFWFDDQDKEEFSRKLAAEIVAENERKERLNQLEPIISLLSTAAGRALKAKEVRIIDRMNAEEMNAFTRLMVDIVAAQNVNGLSHAQNVL